MVLLLLSFSVKMYQLPVVHTELKPVKPRTF